ncbi:MAG: leucyl aminopeptidase family protein [Geminicoccaceae bacterium]
MLDCFAPPGSAARMVAPVTAAQFPQWQATAPPVTVAWLQAIDFKAKPGAVALLPGSSGALEQALLTCSDPAELWDVASLPGTLPTGDWAIAAEAGCLPAEHAVLGWALASYRFRRYRPDDGPRPRLVLPAGAGVERATHIAEATWLARDLINTPANDLGPAELADAVAAVAERFGAECRIIVGDALLDAGYPAVHAVGRASTREPRLIDLTWGDPTAPRVTLVGKGVCFDTGGLDIKPSSNMLMMKKDMGGSAVMLALAQCVMALGLPLRLRLLIPAVENSIGGAAFRPGDVLTMRNGITVEITNTDAEGRLVLADALVAADAESPRLLLDAATLTGAARVALGPELPALFTPDDDLAHDLLRLGTASLDPLWRLPLHAPYLGYMKSQVAELANASMKPFAGASTAALFLQEFVKTTHAWAHLDMFAWNDDNRPGRPRGGEATALRALLALVEERFGAGRA